MSVDVYQDTTVVLGPDHLESFSGWLDSRGERLVQVPGGSAWVVVPGHVVNDDGHQADAPDQYLFDGHIHCSSCHRCVRCGDCGNCQQEPASTGGEA